MRLCLFPRQAGTLPAAGRRFRPLSRGSRPAQGAGSPCSRRERAFRQGSRSAQSASPADPAPAPKPLAEKKTPVLQEALTRPDLRPLPDPVTEPLPEPCPACGGAQERTGTYSPGTLSGEEKCGHYHLGNDLIFQRQVQWEQRCPSCGAASSQTETQEERFCYGGNDADALRQRIDSLPPLDLPTV